MAANDNANRYRLHTIIQSPVGRKIRTPHQVIDSRTNLAVDEYASRRAAAADVAERNARQARIDDAADSCHQNAADTVVDIIGKAAAQALSFNDYQYAVDCEFLAQADAFADQANVTVAEVLEARSMVDTRTPDDPLPAHRQVEADAAALEAAARAAAFAAAGYDAVSRFPTANAADQQAAQDAAARRDVLELAADCARRHIRQQAASAAADRAVPGYERRKAAAAMKAPRAPEAICPRCGSRTQVLADGRLIRHFDPRNRWCEPAAAALEAAAPLALDWKIGPGDDPAFDFARQPRKARR